MPTTVVHCGQTVYDVLADRRSKFGNPFIVGVDGDRDEVCDMHILWLLEWLQDRKEIWIRGMNNKWVIEHLFLLKDKKIGCHCAPKRCHVDFLAKLTNSF